MVIIPTADQPSIIALLKWVREGKQNGIVLFHKKEGETHRVKIKLTSYLESNIRYYDSFKDAASIPRVRVYSYCPCPEFNLTDFQQMVDLVAEEVVSSITIFSESGSLSYGVAFFGVGLNFETDDLKELIGQIMVTVTHLS